MGTLATGRKGARSPLRKDPFRREPYNYDGPETDNVKKSIHDFISDGLARLMIPATEEELKNLSDPLIRFIDKFWEELSQRKDGKAVQKFADLSKERRNDFVEFINMILDPFYGSDPSLSDYDLFSISDHGNGEALVIDVNDLDYFPKRTLGFLAQDSQGLSYPLQLSKRPSCYICLYDYAIRLRKYLISCEVTETQSVDVSQMFLFATSIGQLFEKLNPSEEVMQEYIDKTYDILTAEAEDPSYEFFEVLDQVLEDITNPELKNPPRIIRPYRKAYQKLQKELQSDFQLSDYYVAMKGTASKIGNKSYKSIIASLYELDPFQDAAEVKAFDEMCNYISRYQKVPISEGYREFLIKTIHITNPSKFKPRAIHIGMNALQDRCKYLARVGQVFLDSLSNDCTRNHQNGVDFLMLITSKEYRRIHHNSCLNYDFSNATDRLHQKVAKFINKRLFNNEVAEFWDYVSRLPKVMVNADGSERPYLQLSGQPQGLLFSFVDFAISHHMLALVAAYLCNLKDNDPSMIFRILGDDSILSNPNPDPTNELGKFYIWACEQAGLEINLSKSHEFYDPDDTISPVMLDFAKVTIRDGKFFSPLPVNIALDYSNPTVYGDIAAYLWYAYHKVVFKDSLDHCIDRRLTRPIHNLLAKIVIKSGEISYLKDFHDPNFMRYISLPLKGATMFVYGLDELKGSLINFVLSDKTREREVEDRLSFNTIFEDFVPPELESWIEKVDTHHKYIEVMNDACILGDNLSTIFKLKDKNAGYLLASVLIDREAVQDLSMIQEYKLILEMDKDPERDIPQFLWGLDYNYLFGKSDQLTNLQIRSLRVKSKQQARFMKNLEKSFMKYFRTSKPIALEITETLRSLYDHGYLAI